MSRRVIGVIGAGSRTSQSAATLASPAEKSPPSPRTQASCLRRRSPPSPRGHRAHRRLPTRARCRRVADETVEPLSCAERECEGCTAGRARRVVAYAMPTPHAPRHTSPVPHGPSMLVSWSSMSIATPVRIMTRARRARCQGCARSHPAPSSAHLHYSVIADSILGDVQDADREVTRRAGWSYRPPSPRPPPASRSRAV